MPFQVTNKQLRRLWMNMKQRQRDALTRERQQGQRVALTRERQYRVGTGGGPSISDAAIDPDVSQCEIELLSDNVDEAYADRDQFESKLFRLLSVAHGLLAAAARYPAAGAPGGDGTSDAAEECRGGGFVRLPKIDLPHFDGDYQHWLSFRDTAREGGRQAREPAHSAAAPR
ncbi:hypothetical protein JYU34_010507 [Plutella xylostella]|uniref:Uncharacterized protein n=1 Tax=Plutella xylostella TaxID=51655 RepID=A0ABQ7QIJ0_PLUXY|nr:hypothetical protein JYU34_010507 [Plutella xylostella]